MDRRPDRTAAEQLLADPAGAGDDRVAELLAAAAHLSASEPSAELLADMADAARSSHDTPHLRRNTPVRTRTLTRTALVAAALTLTATSAAAAAGDLPDPAQDALATAAERVGFDLPRSGGTDENDDVEEVETAETETEGIEGDEVADEAEGTEAADPEANDHGQMVSSISRDDYESGREYGEAVSDAARQRGLEQRGETDDSTTAAEATTTGEGHGQAGEHGKAPVATPNQGEAGAAAGNPAAEQAPVVTPNGGAAAEDTPAADHRPDHAPKGT